jgi:hypothetical protein
MSPADPAHSSVKLDLLCAPAAHPAASRFWFEGDFGGGDEWHLVIANAIEDITLGLLP